MWLRNLYISAGLKPVLLGSSFPLANKTITIYNLGKSDTIGRYMVAKRDINPGEVIFTDQPAVIGQYYVFQYGFGTD